MTLFRPPTIAKSFGYPNRSKTALVTPASGKCLGFVGATLNNRSTGSCICGVGFQLDNTRWRCANSATRISVQF